MCSRSYRPVGRSGRKLLLSVGDVSGAWPCCCCACTNLLLLSAEHWHFLWLVTRLNSLASCHNHAVLLFLMITSVFLKNYMATSFK